MPSLWCQENHGAVSDTKDRHKRGDVRMFNHEVSESLWKSLAVKSLRMGWPAGIKAAAGRLNPSTMKSLLTCGVFEDVFPTTEDVPVVLRLIKERDYYSLCVYETHHGQGLTEEFCDYEQEATYAAKHCKSEIWRTATQEFNRLWLPPRSLNCFWTWWQMVSKITRMARSVDNAPFVGIPLAMMDGHTAEGKKERATTSVLSGSYAQHRKLGQMIKTHGWEKVRQLVHEQPVIRGGGEQLTLF